MPPAPTASLRARVAAARQSPGLWAVADQGIVSSGSFLVALVLARRLPAGEFGVFGVLMGVLVVANTAHASVIGIPLMVLSGDPDHRDHLPSVGLAWTAVSIAVFTLAMAVALVLLGRPGLMASAELALVGAQVQETLRRCLIGRLQFATAASGDALSYLGQAGAVVVLAIGGRATVSGVFVIMGLTSLLAAAVQFVQVRPMLCVGALRRDTVTPFWRLGKGLIIVNGIGALTVQSFPWLLAALQGIPLVGSFQALLTVMGFTNPLMLAVNSIVTTRAAHIDASDPVQQRRLELAVMGRYGMLGGLPLIVYGGIVVGAPGLILHLFFAPDSPYRRLGPQLTVFAFFAVMQYVYFVVAGVLNARQDTRSLLWAQAISALTVPLVAAPLIALRSLQGAVVSAVISAAARAAVALVRVLRARAP